MQWVGNWVGQYGFYLVWGLGSPLLLSTVEENLQRSISCLGSFKDLQCVLGEMFQQFVVDPIGSSCTGLSLHDWSPQISQAEGLVVDFGVVWDEVNFYLLILLLYGLECSTVVGRGGVSVNTAACSLAISFGSVMVVPIFPFRHCLRGQMFLPDIFLTLSHTCCIGVSADNFDTDSAHDWHFFWLKSRRAFACDLLKADMVSPLNYRQCRTLLSRARLACRASQHSSSN